MLKRVLGQYKYKVMAIGLTNALAVFMRTRTNMLYMFLDTSVALLLVTFSYIGRHLKRMTCHLRLMLETSRNNKFSAKLIDVLAVRSGFWDQFGPR
jgi:hypothetical protein